MVRLGEFARHWRSGVFSPLVKENSGIGRICVCPYNSPQEIRYGGLMRFGVRGRVVLFSVPLSNSLAVALVPRSKINIGILL